MKTAPETKFGSQVLVGSKSKRLKLQGLVRQPMVEHGDVSRLSAITSIASLASAQSLIDAWDGRPTTVRAGSPHTGKPFVLFPTKDQIQTLYDGGFSILMGELERFIPELGVLCRELEVDLGLAVGDVGAEAFCARSGGRTRAHFDPGFNFNCQLAGTKVWRFQQNDAIQFPPDGMFLHRPPSSEMSKYMTRPLETSLTNFEAVVAVPGTVVMMTPGFLHETEIETDSLSINFSIEFTESIAGSISARVREILRMVPELRAPRLGGQRTGISNEIHLAANMLRELADRIESDSGTIWNEQERKVRGRNGFNFKREGSDSIVISTESSSRTMKVGETSAAILAMCMDVDSFTIRDVVVDQLSSDIEKVKGSMDALIKAGLLECV